MLAGEWCHMIKKLMANTSKISLKVPKGITMAGYDDRKQGNIGTHDELYTKALTIDNGVQKFVIITIDLLGLDDDMVNKITEKINKAEKMDEKNIFICASHTHSAPAVCRWKISEDISSMNDDNKELRNKIIDTIADNAVNSMKSMIPVEIGFGKGICSDVACNRIDKNLPTDHSVNVIELRKQDKNPLCIIVNYTCHPTVMGADNLFITADYPGILQKSIEDHFPESTAMFINGACGDQSTRFTRKSQDFNEVFRLGNSVYESTIKALENISDFQSWVDMKTIKEPVEFPKKQLPSYAEALKRLEEAKINKDKAESGKAEPWEIRQAVTKYQGAAITLELIKYLKDDYKIYSELQLMQLGDTLITGMPVELFVEYGNEIKKISGFKNTIIAGYTNNMLGYVYTPESYEDGDYEAWSSIFAINTGNFIIEKVKDLISAFSIKQ